MQKRLGEMSQTERFRELGRAYWEEVRENPILGLQARLRAVLGFFFGQSFLNDPKWSSGRPVLFEPGADPYPPDAGPRWFWR